MYVTKSFNIIAVSIIIFITACVNKEANDDSFRKNMNSLIQKKVQIDEIDPPELSDEILKSIPSPIQLTSALKAANIPFNSSVINNSANLSNYNSSFSKALNLGIYGADLGYINFYEKNNDAISCLNNIKLLAEDLKVSQFFDFETINRLAQNSKNIDSLIYISTSSFADMDEYLKENGRRNISVLIMYGGWIESMHLLLSSKKDPNQLPETVKERIGEQKIVLENLIVIFDAYKKQPKFLNLIKNLNELNDIYKKVDIKYMTGKTHKKVIDGVLQYVETKTSKVFMSSETLIEIKKKVDLIRKTLV